MKATGDYGLFNALDQIVSDLDFACPVEDFAEKLSENGNSVFRWVTTMLKFTKQQNQDSEINK